MEKILTQEEIDALFRATQKGQLSSGPAAADKRHISNFDLRVVGQINKEQVRSLSTLHESFARHITNSMGAFLRVAFDANLVSVEQLNYSEVLSRLPELTYICSLRLKPLDALAVMQLDLSLAFPIMDLVLGGAGIGMIEQRDLTEIEEEILESVIRIIIRELQASWAPVLEVEFEFDQRQQVAQAPNLMSPNERSLALSFEIKMPDARGMLNLTLPAVASNALFRKLTQQSSFYKHVNSTAQINHLRERMLDSEFSTDFRLPPIPIRVDILMELQPGHILPLTHPVDRPATLLVAGKEMFRAYPVACGRTRGAQILQRNSIIPDSHKVVS